MNTVGKLMRWLRDSGLQDDTPIAIQAYGKPGKHYEWTIEVFAGEVILCADLAPRRRQQPRCPVCNGTEFEPALDNYDEAYTGCVRCALKAL